MLCLYFILISYTIHLLFPFLDMVTGQSNNECVNCTDINGNCTVNETGYKIFPYSENDHKKVILKTPDNTNFTERSEFGDASWLCMVSGTTIIDDLETFVCFWSPEQGCNAVARKAEVGKQHMIYMTCKICSKYCECPVALISSAISIEISHIIVSLIIFFICHILF